MMAIKKKTFVLAFLLLATHIVKAQTELPGEQVEVIKNFDARLLDARKFEIRPQLPPLDTIGTTYEYTVSVDNPAITYPAPVLRPLAVRSANPPVSYNGTARLGYGAPNAVLGQISYFFENGEDLHFGLEFDHNSANRKDVPLQKYSDNDIALQGAYWSSPALAISGDISYSFDKIKFYGTDPTDFTIYLEDGRAYKTFTSEVRIANPERLDGDFDYHASFDYYNHQDDLAARETGGILDFGAKKWIGGEHPLALDIIVDLTTLKDTAKRSLNNFFFQPTFTYIGGQFRIQGGVSLATSNDEFMIYPLVEASVKIIGDRLIGFVGADGGLKKNHFYSLSLYNPFISERITSIRNTEYRSYSGGIKGRLGNLEYESKVSYNTLKDLALFLHSPNDSRKFQPVYDDADIFRIEGVIKAQPIRGLEVGGTIAKHFYDLASADEPWHLPGFEARVFATYVPDDSKLRVHGDVFLENGVPYIDEFNETQRLNSLFDFSIGADYYITDNIGVFIQVNNLFSNKRQRWLRYPTYGINGVGGVTVRL